MLWRPKGWDGYVDEAVEELAEQGIIIVAYKQVEAGADAILKALTELLVSIHSELVGIRMAMGEVPYESQIDKNIKQLALIIGYPVNKSERNVSEQ